MVGKVRESEKVLHARLGDLGKVQCWGGGGSMVHGRMQCLPRKAWSHCHRGTKEGGTAGRSLPTVREGEGVQKLSPGCMFSRCGRPVKGQQGKPNQLSTACNKPGEGDNKKCTESPCL